MWDFSKYIPLSFSCIFFLRALCTHYIHSRQSPNGLNILESSIYLCPLEYTPQTDLGNVCPHEICSSVQFSCSVVSDSLLPHGLQHAKPPCPSPTPGVYSNSCPLSQWCYPAISSSVIPFSSCLQSFPASGSFQMSQLFASGGQSIGVSASASVLLMNIQD